MANPRLAAQYATVLAAVPDATVVTDRRGRLVLLNPVAEALFGYGPGELLDQPVERLIPARFRATHPGHRDGYFQDPRVRPMGAGKLELWGLRKDGSEFPAEISLSPLVNEDGAFAVVAIRDASERRRQEGERARLHAELERASDLMRQELHTQSRGLETLARELASRKRDLEAALEAARAAHAQAERASRIKGDFLALVSHELRTPLALLHLQVEILARNPSPGGLQRTAVQRLRSASRRLRDLVEALLQHSRFAGGQVGPRREQVALRRLVEEAVAEHEPLAEERGLSLRLAGERDLPMLPTDPVLARVVVSNLLGNALKFTAAGHVEVALELEGRDQVVRVSDTGPGIAAADQERIFQAFEQLDPVAAKHLPGVGLGLALVREICAVLGARIELQSELGQGSTFTVRLPGAPAEERAAAPEPPPPSA